MTTKIARASFGQQHRTRPATMDDLEPVVKLINSYSSIFMGADYETVEHVQNEWTIPGFNLETDSCLVEDAAGTPVGYLEVWDITDPPVQVWAWGCVHPDHRNQGIGTYLMGWGEERARRALSRVPQNLRVVLRAFTVTSDEAAKRLFLNRGMRKVRHNWDMVIDLDQPIAEPQWPSGITLRTYDQIEDAERVYRATDEAFQDHWGYVPETFETAFPEWQHSFFAQEVYDPKLWFLAMDGDEIAGLIISRPRSEEDPEMGWVRVLIVRRLWRKRGIATALLLQAFHEFKRRGKRRVGLGVDAQNLTGAVRLYEKVGMHVHREYESFELELRPGKDLRMLGEEGEHG